MKTAFVALMALIGQAAFAVACPMIQPAIPETGPTVEHPPFARSTGPEDAMVLYIDPRSKFCACGIDPAVLQHFLAGSDDAPEDGGKGGGDVSPK